MCCCAYGHPNTDTSKFVNYFENTYAKLDTNKEDKLIFISGDVNINLLNYESHSNTNIFLNSMVSKCLLPYILHPTRVTDHSATVTDNIFSNNFEYETVSENTITQIAHHFPQFMHLKKLMSIINCVLMGIMIIQTLTNKILNLIFLNLIGLI